jgi:hypothetical protein
MNKRGQGQVRGVLCFLLCNLLYGLSPCIYSQAVETQALSPLITGISIVGLKKTRLSTMEKSLGRFLGQDAASLDTKVVHGVIVDMGILEPVSIRIEDQPENLEDDDGAYIGMDERSRGSGKLLRIEVQEKWSLFPVPVASIGSKTWGMGAFFVDTNAFGLNDKFFLGGMYKSDGWLVIGGYMHSGGGEGIGWGLSGSFNRQERFDTDQHDTDLRRFDLDRIRASAHVRYSTTNVFSGGLRFSFTKNIPEDALEAAGTVFGIGPELSVKNIYWDGFLLSEQSASLEYSWMMGASYFHVIKAVGVYEQSLIPGFSLNMNVGLVYAPGVPVLFELPPSAVQIAILPDSFAAQHYAGASLGFEKYLFRGSLGTVSALFLYQAVYSHGSLLGDTFDHGLAGYLTFFLSQLAVPAVSVGAAYNVAADYAQGSFSLGMTF